MNIILLLLFHPFEFIRTDAVNNFLCRHYICHGGSLDSDHGTITYKGFYANNNNDSIMKKMAMG